MTDTPVAAQATEAPKAYDVKELLSKLKDKGVDVAEEAAKDTLEAVFEWLEESNKVSPNAYVTLVEAALLPKLKEFLYAQVDKINGKVDA